MRASLYQHERGDPSAAPEKRNALVEAGRTDAYYADENLAQKFASIFEAPDEGERDLVVNQ